MEYPCSWCRLLQRKFAIVKLRAKWKWQKCEYVEKNTSDIYFWSNGYYRRVHEFILASCSELVFFLYWNCKSMNNVSSYYGLTDSRMSVSDKNSPVLLLRLETSAYWEKWGAKLFFFTHKLKAWLAFISRIWFAKWHRSCCAWNFYYV